MQASEIGTRGMPKKWKVEAWVAFGTTLALFAFAPEILRWAIEQESGRIERVMLVGLVAGFGLGASWLWVLARARQAAYGRLGPLTVYLMLVACNALAKGVGYGLLWAGGFVSRATSSETAASVVAMGLQGVKVAQTVLEVMALACLAWGGIWLVWWLVRGRPDVWEHARSSCGRGTDVETEKRG